MIDIVVGLQWGDEGKGKITDYLSEDYDWVVRYQGGSNAGHTVYVDGKKYVTHSIPTGVIRPECKSVITHGCVVNPEELCKEIEELEKLGIDFTDRLFISKDATVVTHSHLLQDEANKKKWGSTGKGIGPAYRDKYDRRGIKLGSIVNDVAYGKLAPFMTDTRKLLLNVERNGDKILMEGAQAVMLDIDFGTYPYVTSSPCTANYAPQGTGLPLSMFGDSAVIGVVKSYTTRIGTGPFPTEFEDEYLTEMLREAGGEYGATTGRPRRMGWLDMDQLRYACEVNGITNLAITKLDVLSSLSLVYIKDSDDPADPNNGWMEFPSWKLTGEEKTWSDLPQELKDYVSYISNETGCLVSMVGVGQDRDQLIMVE
tara:strand:+ start:2772 stop:3881 length:1110 start_codon:yes stop_codon:yes gene_type:complete